ncbi:32575_t:CDS:2 [Gigaspora margarita]|uniref:32575_t:CDS:1 n=1 Tax=Gigaspora margarita TaxID=4874 RepID=A0ABN7VV29_GIGMA|nr:32575_t:CDS:2 [Gigaspora margarita]
MAEQLEHHHAQQREAYRLRTEAESSQQTKYRQEKVSGSIFTPVFSTCCANGKIQLPTINQLPEPLLSLLTREDSRSRNFRKNIHKYNSVLSFTSIGAKIDRNVVGTQGVPSDRITFTR